MQRLLSCALAALVLAAPTLAAPALAAERTVTDDTGRAVAIPQAPRRIVVMHEPLLGIPLMDLGVDLAGSFGRSDEGEFVIAVDFIDTVLGGSHDKPKGFGPVGQPDLEKLRALEPDLILATELDAGRADQLASVAPVYLQNVGGTKVSGFGVQEDLADLLGLEETFGQRRSDYMDRVDAVRAALPGSPEGKTYLPVFLTDQLNIVGNSSGMVQALEDLGYSRLDVASPGGNAAGGGSMMLVPLSAEAFGTLNPDVLVLLNSYMDASRTEDGTRAKLDRIVPGWDRFMKPALEGRILYVDPARVITPTIASAEHMLDAFEAWAARGR